MAERSQRGQAPYRWFWRCPPNERKPPFSALVQGPLDVSGFITHLIGINDYEAGFADMRSGNSGEVVMD